MRRVLFLALIVPFVAGAKSASITIPAGKPELRIRELVEQVGWDVLYNAGMFKEPSIQRATSAVTGETDPVIALRKMLASLPLKFEMISPTTLYIEENLPISRTIVTVRAPKRRITITVCIRHREICVET